MMIIRKGILVGALWLFMACLPGLLPAQTPPQESAH